MKEILFNHISKAAVSQQPKGFVIEIHGPPGHPRKAAIAIPHDRADALIGSLLNLCNLVAQGADGVVAMPGPGEELYISGSGLTVTVATQPIDGLIGLTLALGGALKLPIYIQADQARQLAASLLAAAGTGTTH